ncbi:MAG: major capsid protein, partial [Methylocystis sp.]
SGAQGIRTYGAILDRKVLQALSRFPKVWDEEDPSVTYTMTQSAPLPLLGWIEATAGGTVN